MRGEPPACIYAAAKKSRRASRLDKDEPLKEAVCQRFDHHWSPEIIAAKHNEANPNFQVDRKSRYLRAYKKQTPTNRING